MRTVFGILADRDGLASDTILGQGEDRPELRMRAWATPAEDVRRVQAPRIPIDRDHDGRFVGELVHLELRDGNLWAVGQVADDVLPAVNVGVGGETVRVEQDLFWSASRLSTPDYGDVIIDSVSLTPFPCRVAARPLTFLEGDLHNRSRWTLDSRARAAYPCRRDPPAQATERPGCRLPPRARRPAHHEAGGLDR